MQRWHLAIQLAILSAVYLALRIPLLTSALWHDEIYNTSLYLSALPLLQANPDSGWGVDWARQISTHPPLVSLGYFVWIHLFGDSELSLHTPTLFAGLLSVWLTHLLGRELFDATTGFVASLALACCSAHMVFSTQAVHAVFELTCYAASVLLLYRLWRTRDVRTKRGLLALNILGALTFYHYMYYLAAQTAVLWWRRREHEVGAAYFVIALSAIVGFGLFALFYSYAGNIDMSDFPANDLSTTIYNGVHLPQQFTR
jgi:4-amino-4-deoxy-L-arabinose transferase-like glycosyltransferase